MIAGLLRDRIRLVLENQRLRRELDREREARLAIERGRRGDLILAQDLDEGDIVAFGEPTTRRSTHLRIVSRRQMAPVIDPAEFTE